MQEVRRLYHDKHKEIKLIVFDNSNPTWLVAAEALLEGDVTEPKLRKAVGASVRMDAGRLEDGCSPSEGLVIVEKSSVFRFISRFLKYKTDVTTSAPSPREPSRFRLWLFQLCFHGHSRCPIVDASGINYASMGLNAVPGGLVQWCSCSKNVLASNNIYANATVSTQSCIEDHLSFWNFNRHYILLILFQIEC